jgi:hypothetical protein
LVRANLLHFIYLCVLQIQIEEEEKKLKCAIEEAEKQYSEVSSEMKDLEIKSKQFEELEERLVFFSACHYCFRHLPVIVVLLVICSIFMHLEFWGILSQNHGLCTTLCKALTPSAPFLAPAICNAANTFHAKLMLFFY